RGHGQPSTPSCRCRFCRRSYPIRGVDRRQLCRGRAVAFQCARRNLGTAAASVPSRPLPFFCAATCIGLTLVAFPERIGRTYRYDLVGASMGAIGLMLALIVLFPDVALKVVAMFGFLAAALAISVRETGVVRKRRAVGYATT